MILKALSGNKAQLENLSSARDTQTLIRLLSSEQIEWDVKDAGTTMRFLLALASVSNQNKILTGTPRMCERPIGVLVDALRKLGGSINYLQKEGFPPMETKGFVYNGCNVIEMDATVSSQYISAICMIAPLLPNGLTIHLLGKLNSAPYLDMTLAMMRAFGASAIRRDKVIEIQAIPYQSEITFSVESDWSGAGYWFSLVALSDSASIVLSGLKADSLQGDALLVEVMKPLGVQARFIEGGLLLEKAEVSHVVEIDFSQIPDQAQTIVPLCAALGIGLKARGLESLRIKETDRIHALQMEIQKLGVPFSSQDGVTFELPKGERKHWQEPILIQTYDDHRMALGFAPLALCGPLQIQHPDVVQKSYPEYWSHLQAAGWELEFISA